MATVEGDLVLVHIDNQPAFFARIESIFADVKPQWFQVRMLVLQVPLTVITWILREPYIDGEEFTMGGRPITMEKVVAPDDLTEESEPPGDEAEVASTGDAETARVDEGKGPGKVISLTERLKKTEKP
jgi:hypothetical protein